MIARACARVPAARVRGREIQDTARAALGRGVIGCLEALEAIKYICGIGELLCGRLLTFDALKGDFHTIKLPPRDHNCAVCGDHPTITELIDYEQPECADAQHGSAV